MKSVARNWGICGLLTASVLALAACGGGGGGGGHGGGGGLASGTFTRTVDMGGVSYTGLLGLGAYAHYQYLFLAANVGGAGRITGLAIKYNSAVAAEITCPNATMKLSHSNLANLTTTFASNLGTGQGGQTTVLNNATMTFPVGAASSWQTISFATPFDYNGVDNLIVEVERTSACSATVQDNATTPWPYTAGVYTFTNGSATGTADTWAANSRFVFSGGDNKLTFAGVNGNTFPFANTAATSGRRTQHLYLASEVNGSGPITGVAFQANALTLAGTYTYTLRFGHSTLTALGATFASNYAGSPTTVANAVTNFTIPANIPAGEWIWIPIPDDVFVYNGTDNLVVDVSVPTGSASNPLRNLAGMTSRRVFNNSDAAATTGTVDDFEYHIALRFHGGQVAKLTPSATAWNNNTTFNNLWSSATLYSATDLGTAGSITSVSCRLLSASTAASYANFRVIMGHATGSTLSGTAATDFVSQNTVFDGTFNVPGGLPVGDWVDVPLSTPFAYDGKSNLIVWMGNAGPGPGTATITDCQGESDARYPSGMGITQAGAGSAGYGPINWTTDIRMTIQK